MELLSDEAVLNHTMENLHRFLDKHYTVSEPVSMLRTRWYTNPHFRGTYSYRSVDTDKKKVYSEMLEKPLENGVTYIILKNYFNFSIIINIQY